MRDGLEVHSLRLQQWKGAGRSGIGIEPLKCTFETVAVSRRNRVVDMGGQEVQLRIADRARGGSKLRCAQPQVGIQISKFIACAKFREPGEAIADIGTDVSAIQPVLRQRIVLAEDLEGGTGRVAVRCDKPSTRRRKGPIEFARYA